MQENQIVIRELEKLFDRVPPRELRYNIQTIFQICSLDKTDSLSDEQRKVVANFYFLDLFLTEAENAYEANGGTEDSASSI